MNRHMFNLICMAVLVVTALLLFGGCGKTNPVAPAPAREPVQVTITGLPSSDDVAPHDPLGCTVTGLQAGATETWEITRFGHPVSSGELLYPGIYRAMVTVTDAGGVSATAEATFSLLPHWWHLVSWELYRQESLAASDPRGGDYGDSSLGWIDPALKIVDLISKTSDVFLHDWVALIFVDGYMIYNRYPRYKLASGLGIALLALFRGGDRDWWGRSETSPERWDLSPGSPDRARLFQLHGGLAGVARLDHPPKTDSDSPVFFHN